jgi:transcription elongation factor Elf1
MLSCSLCGMEFDFDDPLLQQRIQRHERWHKNCRGEKRNTTEGSVEWIKGEK